MTTEADKPDMRVLAETEMKPCAICQSRMVFFEGSSYAIFRDTLVCAKCSEQISAQVAAYQCRADKTQLEIIARERRLKQLREAQHRNYLKRKAERTETAEKPKPAEPPKPPKPSAYALKLISWSEQRKHEEQVARFRRQCKAHAEPLHRSASHDGKLIISRGRCAGGAWAYLSHPEYN